MDKNTSFTRLAQTIDRIDGAYATATIRAYKADFNCFIEFCDSNKIQALPCNPESIASYIDKLMRCGQSSASIRRVIAAIATIHTLNDYINPTLSPVVKIEMKRMHRTLGRHSNQANAITKDIMEVMLDSIKDDSLRSLRDKAILMISYDTMCRRAELVDIEIRDIRKQIINQKLNIYSTVINLRKSKTDQESHGRWMPIGKDASDAIENWIYAAQIERGKLFRAVNRGNQVANQLSSSHISRIYKKIATKAGLDKNFVKHVSGHSIRVGAAQDLLLSGASLAMMMSKGRWSKSDTVMRYVEKIGAPY